MFRLVQVLGTRSQNQMRFISGNRWQQVALVDCQPGQALTKVDPAPIAQPEFRRALMDLV
jgi:hypothetical protein